MAKTKTKIEKTIKVISGVEFRASDVQLAEISAAIKAARAHAEQISGAASVQRMIDAHTAIDAACVAARSARVAVGKVYDALSVSKTDANRAKRIARAVALISSLCADSMTRDEVVALGTGRVDLIGERHRAMVRDGVDQAEVDDQIRSMIAAAIETREGKRGRTAYVRTLSQLRAEFVPKRSRTVTTQAPAAPRKALAPGDPSIDETFEDDAWTTVRDEFSDFLPAADAAPSASVRVADVSDDEIDLDDDEDDIDREVSMIAETPRERSLRMIREHRRSKRDAFAIKSPPRADDVSVYVVDDDCPAF